MFPVPRTLQGAPELSPAEREALVVLAEHTRTRARLDCVWLFTHTPDLESDSDLELVAYSCGESSEPLAEAAARAAVVRTTRGQRRRFKRGRGAEAAGTRVTTASGAASAVSAAGQPGPGGWVVGAEPALAELAAVSLRLAAGPLEAAAAEQAPAAPAEEAARAEPEDEGAKRHPVRAVGDPERPFGPGLAASMALLEEPPILTESRTRLSAALNKPRGSVADSVQTIETDIGLALAVVARANRLPGRSRGGIASIPEAVQALGPKTLGELVDSLPLLRAANGDRVSAALARITPHAIATRAAADLIASRTGASDRDGLRLAAMLHDIGKVALAAASGTYLDRAIDTSSTPGDRAARERRALGIDHAGLGAIALGRLGVPRRVASAVERHHADDADGAAAVIRLADMLAHEARGDAVDPKAFGAAGEAVGIKASDLRMLAYELAREGGPRIIGGEPSPLTPMQQKVLVGLRRGLTYKQIAVDLQVSESTVRSHLHKTYERLGVVDRAQAVLLAQDRGWI
jgi:putative nucleotidyltransferase with HDIG domain